MGFLNFEGAGIRGRKAGSNSRGFTLLELIVVCFLIGIMLVVSVPTLKNTFVDDPLKATARKIIGFINGVRELAAREQQPYFLFFDRGDTLVRYEKDIPAGLKETKEVKQELDFPAEVKLSEIWTQSEGVYGDDQNRIWISPKGYMDQTVLHLADKTRVMSLHFSPFLESVTIYDKYTPGR